VVVNAFMLREASEFVVLRLVSDQTAIGAHKGAQVLADAAMIERHGTDIAASFDKTENLWIVSTAAEVCWPLGLARLCQFRFVGFHCLASAAKRTSRNWRHCLPDTHSKEPCGFHAALEHPLDLTGANAFLAGAEQVDHLQPQVQAEVAILENGAHTHREGLFAGVTFVEAGTGRFAAQLADPLSAAAMVAYRAIRPQSRLHESESCRLGLELRGVEN
jgi:hypothetical protein